MNEKRMTFKELSTFLESKVDLLKAHLMTDEYKGYDPMHTIVPEHSSINHSLAYAWGDIHTNTIRDSGL